MMRKFFTWLAILALAATALSAELPAFKKGSLGVGDTGDLKTASTFIGPFGYGWGYGGWVPYGKGLGLLGGWGGWGWGWGYPYPYWG